MQPALGRASILGFIACLLAACASGSPAPAQPPPAPPPTGDSAASASEAPQPSAQPNATATAPSEAPTADTAKPAAAAPVQPSLVELCEQGCKKIKARCTESAYDSCHMNCVQYEHPPEGCEAEARVALECARDAEDVTCVNIAPEICAPKFRRVVACSNGQTVETKDEEGPRTPSGWQRYSAPKAGFSTLMPKGVTEAQEDGQPQFSTKEGDATYLVRVLPAPAERPTQKSMVKVALGALGKCNRSMKLFGMVDRPEKIFIRFDSKCPDGAAWRGAFFIVGNKMYMPYVVIPKSMTTKPEVDAFLYSFEAGKTGH